MSLAPKFEHIDVDEENEVRVLQLESTDVDVQCVHIFFQARHLHTLSKFLCNALTWS